ncbi:helicase-related protein, partial [Clostridium cadaveris]
KNAFKRAVGHLLKEGKIEIKAQKLITDNIEHNLYRVDDKEKLEALNKILVGEVPKTTIVFCRTKDNVDLTYDYLNKKGYSIGKIHGGMLQKERLEVMEAFRRGDFRILIATDIAARGIDIEGITHVINIDVPMEKEAYVHRIGRTGRAGSKGKAITFATQYEDRFLNDIFDYIGFSIEESLMEEISKEEIEKSVKVLTSKPKAKNVKSKSVNKGITKIYLNGGKKKKIRAVDIVGAVSRIEGVNGDDIGIIDIQDMGSYVEILNGKGNLVMTALKDSTIKGKKLRVEKARK